MFLALREIKHEKIRYTLIVAVIALISYLIFILSALALGLANQNTAAIKSWQVQSIALNKDANANLGQSLLTKADLDAIPKSAKTATIGISPISAKDSQGKHDTVSAQFVGLNQTEYVARNLKPIQGRTAKNNHEVVVSDKFKDAGYQLNDKLSLGLAKSSYQIVGFVKNATYNIGPVVYGSLKDWQAVKGVNPTLVASGVINQDSFKAFDHPKAVTVIDRQTLFDKLPGYQAQNLTFTFMIGFLAVISLLIITIFLYILTVQKKPSLAVLRAQGIPSQFLIKNTFNQTLLILVVGVALSFSLALLTSHLLPAAVPMYFDIPLLSIMSGGIIITGLLGSLIPIVIISRIDPITVIGG